MAEVPLKPSSDTCPSLAPGLLPGAMSLLQGCSEGCHCIWGAGIWEAQSPWQRFMQQREEETVGTRKKYAASPSSILNGTPSSKGNSQCLRDELTQTKAQHPCKRDLDHPSSAALGLCDYAALSFPLTVLHCSACTEHVVEIICGPGLWLPG